MANNLPQGKACRKVSFTFLLIMKTGKFICLFSLLLVLKTPIFAHENSTGKLTKDMAERAFEMLNNRKIYMFYCKDFASNSSGKALKIEINDVIIKKDAGPMPNKSLSLKEIVTGLKTKGNSPETSTLTARKRFITKRIYQMGTDFPLTEENKKILWNNGAEDDLINAIKISKDPWLLRINAGNKHPADIYIKMDDKWVNLAWLLNVPIYDSPKYLTQDLL